MADKEKTATEQAEKLKGRNPDGTFAVGNTPVTGFHTNPERRHNGSWHKEDTPRYWLETMMKMSEAELMTIYDNESEPFFKRKLAKCINYV